MLERNQRRCNCIVCGEVLEAGKGFKVAHYQKGFAYVCRLHNHDLSYCADEAQSQGMRGTAKSTALANITVGMEHEVSYISEELTGRLQTLGFQRTQDCTVYREMKSPVWKGLASPSKVFDLFDKAITAEEMSTENRGRFTAGTHLNMGYEGIINEEGMDKVRRFYHSLFLQLNDFIVSLPSEKRIEIFGRDFADWAVKITEGSRPTEHKNWINVENSDSHNKRIEYRLPVYRNKKQYLDLMKCFRYITLEVCYFITEFREDMPVEEKKILALKHGRNMVKKFKKYYNL